MNTQPACAKQHTGGFKAGRLLRFLLNTEHRTLNTLFALLAAGLMAGTAYGQRATGGDTIAKVGNYWVHTFTNVGTAQFTPTNGNMTVQYLVVGGGGGGGNSWGTGGGGAGGLITSVAGCYSGGGTPGVGSTPSLPAVLTASTPYDVTVGGGGPAANNGFDSVFGNSGAEFARAKGGGRGGNAYSENGQPGGSGGGAGGYLKTGGAGTANQGFAGGAEVGNADEGGGGGGAGNVGYPSYPDSNSGRGGPGLTNTITGNSVVYAGGGGGGSGAGHHGGGGAGGGGPGHGGNGTDGLGGGGGGGGGITPGKGGSGIVIIRYKDGANNAPVVVGKNITAYISSNKVTVAAQQIDNGSSDADNDPLLYKINGQDSVTYTQADLGNQTVTLTVYDGFGGSNSVQQTVSVLGGGGMFKASGGDYAYIYTNSGVVYGVHTFTTVGSSGRLIPTVTLDGVEYLVVGGGGAGGQGNWGSGGGGAGGLLTSVQTCYSGGGTLGVGSAPSNTVTLTAGTTYAVTVGDGGTGTGNPGGDSVFGISLEVRAKGGGGGGSGYGANGGSGGGTSGQGFAGAGWASDDAGGGGGGAGRPGQAGSASGGWGGAGLTNTITGSPVVYAGGGGGGSQNLSQGGAGGGGGANSPGTANTGGGGGGSQNNTAGKNGGSGIVIVRYVVPQPAVNVTAPTNNQVFAWNYASIAATATVANATVTSVDFYTNTASAAYGLAGSDSDPTGGYTLSLAGGSLPPGTNHIYAVLVADEGTFYSATNAIIVETLPTVTVTFPTDGQSFANLSSITATATVSHGIAPYTVTFYTNNETSVGTDSSSPYTSSVLGPLTAEGSYQIYAKVTDSNPNGADTVYSTTNTFTILPPALAVSVTGPTEYPYSGTIASTATVVFATGSYTVKVWTSSVPATVWGQAGADGISTSPYGVSFGPLASGQYSIRATVDDALPASATSSTYTVTVLQAPTVTLNTPTNNAQFAWNSSVTGTVTCALGKTPYSVTFYTNKNGSAYGPAGTDAGTGTRTSFTNVLSSLGAGTYGIYALATDAYSSVATSGTNIFLVGGTLPTLSHRPPTAVTTGSATFNGFLSTTGNPATYVYVLYGQDPNAWSFTNAVTAPGGGWTNNSPISTNIGGLTPGLTYYYTIGASNGAPFNATTTASGNTNFITGEVTVQNTGSPAQWKAGGSSNGQFTIYRPATCTNAALVVSYTLNGATVSPSGSATLNAGIASAVVTVAPSFLLGYNSNAVLTLTPGAGNYPYGTPVANSATCTVLAADTTPTAPFYACGGDSNFTITVSGRSYPCAVHIYTNVGSGYFIPSRRIQNVEFLVVGGGGGGGSGNGSQWSAGGGGAGGLITSVIGCYSGGGTPGTGSAPTNTVSLAGGTVYTVTVGDGGTMWNNGQDSVFGNGGNEFARAKGGGAGGGINSGNGSLGGSGGGAGLYGSHSGGAGTANQGFAGGDDGGDEGGGGGGAGNVGIHGSTSGNGGPGLANSIIGSSVVYAGGGGGARGNGGQGTGGSGVGGNGGGGGAGGTGMNGRGGGGGGGGGQTGYGAKGGSGIVIVRYELVPPAGTMILLR